jgi:mannitol/fructose-specific phosphotransferase system IIA component (Ntr-type)
MPPREYDAQLKLLSAMARLMTREEVRNGLLQTRTPGEVISLLDDAGRTPIPEVGQAVERRA